MRYLGILLLVLVARMAWAAPVKVENVRIWAAPDSTRVVFDVDTPVKYTADLLSDPFRVVVDIQDAEIQNDLTQPAPQDKFVQRMRSAPHDGDLRVVMDLKKFSRIKSFQLQPNDHYGNRLVIDLYNRDGDSGNTDPDQESQATSLRDVIVAIDAGHGGEDPGARGPRGTYEKDVTLQMARKLADKVNHERGMKAVLVRQGDYYISLRKRMEVARQHRADLFVSIHADSFRDPHVRGSSVYVLSQRGASSEHARWLAEQENSSDLIGGVSLDDKDDMLAAVLLDLSQSASLEASIDVADRVLHGLRHVGAVHRHKVESAAFVVLKSPDIPSILVETAYISNPDEERKLRTDAYQQQMADAILDGLRGYFHARAPEGTVLASHQRIISHGDTLSGIAQEYGVSVESLRHANHLSGDTIHTGQVLDIPGSDDI